MSYNPTVSPASRVNVTPSSSPSTTALAAAVSSTACATASPVALDTVYVSSGSASPSTFFLESIEMLIFLGLTVRLPPTYVTSKFALSNPLTLIAYGVVLAARCFPSSCPSMLKLNDGSLLHLRLLHLPVHHSCRRCNNQHPVHHHHIRWPYPWS